MNSLLFESIEIRGFKSIIKPLIYNLNTPGLVVLNGENGSGKTTIFSALTWCLYGKTLKKGTNPEPYKFIRDKNYKGTYVSTKFTLNGVSFEVVRTYKYKEDFGLGTNTTLVAIKKEGKWLKGIRDISDGKTQVEKILGHSYDLFVNTILFGQKLKRLIQETGPNRNKVLEEAFDVTFIREGQKIAEEKIAQMNQTSSKYLSELEGLTKDIKNITQTIEDKKSTLETLKNNLVKIKKAQKKIKESQIQRLVTKIKNLKTQIQEKEKEAEEYSVYEARYQELKSQIFRQEIEIDNTLGDIENSIKELEDSKPDRKQKKCPTCGTVFKPVEGQRYKDIVEVWRRKVERARKTQAELKKSLEIKKGRLEKMKKKCQEHKIKVEKYNEIKGEIKMLGVERNKAIAERIELNKKKKVEGLSGLRKMITDLTREVSTVLALDLNLKESEHRLTLEEYRKFSKEYQAYLWVSKEALSNKGLKAYIFHEKIKYLNRILSDYADYLGYQIIFSIDLDSRSKEFKTRIYRGTHLRDYTDLSGGQQQLVDVGTAFALHELKEASFECNLLIMDEVFEHLDASNIEIVAQLIMMKAQSKSVHLITHLDDFNTAAAEVLTLKLNKKEQTEIKNG